MYMVYDFYKLLLRNITNRYIEQKIKNKYLEFQSFAFKKHFIIHAQNHGIWPMSVRGAAKVGHRPNVIDARPDRTQYDKLNCFVGSSWVDSSCDSSLIALIVEKKLLQTKPNWIKTVWLS